jgi:uncharacterized protein (DUF433 family)
LLERITVDSSVRFGKPCIGETRISVGDILGYLPGGMSEQDLLKDFPQLTRDDIRACLAHAVERERRTFGIPAARRAPAFDEQRSEASCSALADEFPETVDVRRLGAGGGSDSSIWGLAQQHDLHPRHQG